QPAEGSSAGHHHHVEADQPTMGETWAKADHGSGKAEQPSGTKCVQCAPCCGAVAPQAETPGLAADVVNADTVLQQVRSLVVGGRIDRIDRPPRSLT
ncbi:MAG: hypothetical protein ACT6S0_05840, partial [Roseateles sp.]